jgi:ABC-type antimicrobial peptide transport system permease subunit
VVVSETLARRYFPEGDALGRRIAFGVNASNWQTIVGVARDMRDTGLEGEPRAVAYVPYGAVAWSFMTLLVRSQTDPAPLAGAVRRAIWAVDPALPLPDMRPLDGFRADATAGARFSMLLMTTFAVVALVLGVLGVYGVTLFSVARRTRELGLRLALGARRRNVLAMVLGQSIRTIALGVLLGLAGAAALSRLLAALLFETAPREPALYAGAAIGLALVALVGSLMPALRATRVDPKVALSAE